MSSPAGWTRAQLDNMVNGKLKGLTNFKRKAVPNLEAMHRVALYIYNLCDAPVTWQQAGFPRMNVKACEKGKPYSDPLPIMEMYAEEYLGSGDTTEFNWYNADEMAGAVMQFGPGIPASLDLRKRGLFTSKTNPPSQQDVATAKQLLRETMLKLLRDGDAAISAGNPKEINEEHRRAADYLGQPRKWNEDHVAMSTCPECGQPIPETASICFGPGRCGAVISWDRAIASGLKKESERPEPVATGLSIKEKK